MRHKQILTGLLAVATLAGTSAQPPEPPERIRLQLTYSPTLPGSQVFLIASHCLGGPDGPVTSSGFTTPATLTQGEGEGVYHGSTTVLDTEGSHTATLRCKGLPDPAEVAFTIRDPWTLGPTEIDPGGTMVIGYVGTGGTSGCGGNAYVTSPGFVAPIQFISGHSGASGRGPAITTPGTYQATFACTIYPTVKRSFTILGTPPVNPPTTPRVVVPLGAPQTGGGGNH